MRKSSEYKKTIGIRKSVKGGNRRLLIECIKTREREKGSKRWGRDFL